MWTDRASLGQVAGTSYDPGGGSCCNVQVLPLWEPSVSTSASRRRHVSSGVAVQPSTSRTTAWMRRTISARPAAADVLIKVQGEPDLFERSAPVGARRSRTTAIVPDDIRSPTLPAASCFDVARILARCPSPPSTSSPRRSAAFHSGRQPGAGAWRSDGVRPGMVPDGLVPLANSTAGSAVQSSAEPARCRRSAGDSERQLAAGVLVGRRSSSATIVRLRHGCRVAARRPLCSGSAPTWVKARRDLLAATGVGAVSACPTGRYGTTWRARASDEQSTRWRAGHDAENGLGGRWRLFEYRGRHSAQWAGCCVVRCWSSSLTLLPMPTRCSSGRWRRRGTASPASRSRSGEALISPPRSGSRPVRNSPRGPSACSKAPPAPRMRTWRSGVVMSWAHTTTL